MTGETILAIVIALVVTFGAMVLHEIMHGLTAYWLGDDTAKRNGRLTLNPFAHVDPYMTIVMPVITTIYSVMSGGASPIFGGAKPVPINPHKLRFGDWGVALTAIAGPLTNLVLAFICYVIYTVSPIAANSILGLILSYAVNVNLSLFAFNILPIPPLDGSRVLYAVAPDWARDVMNRIESYGTLLVFIIVMVASPVITKLLSAIMSGTLAGFNLLIGLF